MISLNKEERTRIYQRQNQMVFTKKYYCLRKKNTQLSRFKIKKIKKKKETTSQAYLLNTKDWIQFEEIGPC